MIQSQITNKVAFALDFQIEWLKTRIKMSLEEWLTEMRAESFQPNR